ncbi:MAG: GDSL-type esterase/lipase family protein [Verrucomicrobiota bacterium]
MAAFAAQDAAKPPPADVIVFVGSSTITNWKNLADSFPDWPVLNRGFGGSKMSDVLDHYDQVVKPYKAPLILLYEGDNDIAEGMTPAAVFQQYVTFVNRVATDFPATEVAIISVKPSPSRASILAKMQDLNARLQNLCATTPRLRYVDTATPMLNGSGQPRPELFGSDMLHMNASGYTLWTQVITPVLDAVFPGIPDNVPPVITAAVPVGGSGLEIKFSKKLNAASVTAAGSWTLDDDGNSITASTLLTDAKTVRLTLASPAAGSLTVRVSGVTDTFGNPVAADTQAVVNFPDQPSEGLLFDFGSSATATTAADDPVNTWNNITSEIGSSATGQLAALKTTGGAVTGIGLAMIRRFNGVNTTGTTSSGILPSDATSDTLFGNTETFSSLTNIFPAFKLTGLPADGTWDLTFYASRTGANDNRETLYTVTGAASATTTLNAANNQAATASVLRVKPNAAGEISIALSPGPANTNANHFTYIGVLRLDPTPPLVLLPPVLANGMLTLDWTGHGTLEGSASLAGPWLPLTTAAKRPFYQEAVLPGQSRFFRLRVPSP